MFIIYSGWVWYSFMFGLVVYCACLLFGGVCAVRLLLFICLGGGFVVCVSFPWWIGTFVIVCMYICLTDVITL